MSWLKSKKTWIGLLVIAAIAAYGLMTYIYKPHERIEDQAVTFKGTSTSLIQKAKENESAIVNGIVALNGQVSNIAADGFTISESIFCQPNDNAILNQLSQGQSISIKGRFIGYDDLLEEVKLDQVILQK